MRFSLAALLTCSLGMACFAGDSESELDAAELSQLDERDVNDLPQASDDDGELADSAEGENDAVLDEEVDGDEPEEVEEEIAEFVFSPHECVHTMDGKRPRITKDTQRQTKRVIAHVAKRMKVSASFRKLLMLVALRESSYQQGLIHRLSPDLKGSEHAWRKMHSRYEGNPHADDPDKWQTYGLFGMNSNYFTLLWDRKADPRVLCDPVVDVLLYKRAAERVLRKLNGTIRCKDENGEWYDYKSEPTWTNVHRAVSGGKLCPSRHEERAAIMRKYFTKRATRINLDPSERVTSKMLGTEPDQSLDGETWASQEEMVMGLWAEIDEAEAELAAKEAEKNAKREKSDEN